MHILILSDFFPPQVNAGAESIAFEISKGYRNEGHKVSVVTINKALKIGELVINKDDEVTCYQIGFNYNEKLSGYVGLYNPTVLKIIKKIIINNNFNVAHIHNIHAYISYSVISLLKMYNIPAILTVHDAMSIDYGKYDQGVSSKEYSLNSHVTYQANYFKIWKKHWKRYNLIRNIFIKHQFKKLKKVVCVSKELEKLLNASGIGNTQVIHNGLSIIDQPGHRDIEEFKNKIGISDNDRILLFAGRLSTAKGFSQAQKLIKRLIEKDSNIKLLVVGKKVDVDTGIANNVINTGWLSKAEMNLVYSVSDITLVPSIYLDPFPTVALESMRLGIPVVISVYTGAKEAVIDGVTGFHVNPFDIDDVASKVLTILYDDQLRYSMSDQSKKEFEKMFTLGKCTSQYLDLLV
ncbi:glycosyltransferase family 4 protein [Candidatus Thioglobus autotrophicus]|uniref:glycosyltransferase family 4 protein n=1 Tax=Candidatus Thioglobus autotrophicus TaxID=1705394 RepID=UPI00299E6E6D|nr:glycosyltransferase family 4 protein [Candidatus Thioglobus autotrophicus]WPE17704.1 glycosyltransferase family 4 protein [Candidatus Thioglobus autotrophicus]